MHTSMYVYVPHFCIPPIMQILLSQIRDPVHNEYQQRPANYFRRLLSKLKKQPLKKKIEYEDYPPCIHMDVMYDDPAVRQEVVTTLEISTLCDMTNYFPLTLTVPSELPLTIVFRYVSKQYAVEPL